MTDAGWAEKGSIFDMASKIVEKDLKTLRDFLTKKPRWAEKVARKAAHSIQPVDFGSSEGIEVFAATLEAEYARSVRIVKKRMKHAQAALKTAGTHVDTSVIAYWDGQEDACANLLTALQRGRGGKG